MMMIINGRIEKDPPEVTPDLSPTAVSDNDGLVEKALDADDTDDVEVMEGDPDDCPDEDPPEGSPLTTEPVKTDKDPSPIHKIALSLRKKDRPKEPRKVTLCTLSYADGEYRLIKKKVDDVDLPRAAVHVTGEKRTWFVDAVRDEDKDPPQIGPGNAIDLHLYMVNNSINSALAASWSKLANIDVKQILVYGFVGIVGICIVWAMIGGMF